MAQFRSLAAFAQFGSNLDRETQRQLDRGLRLNELFKQAQYQTLAVEEQIILIYAGTNGLLDEVPVDRVGEFKLDFLRALRGQYSDLTKDIRANTDKKLSDELAARIDETIKGFLQTWS
jgi:F-type H+-transporting ATPase subunit alpha